MAAANVRMDGRFGGAPPPGSWAQRRIAFHATSTYASAPAMEPLNEPVGRGSGGGHEPIHYQRQLEGQHDQRLPDGQQHRYHQSLNLANGNVNFRKSAEPLSLPSSMPLQWTAPQKIGAGLSNLGNTCFLNSVLQCLTYTPPLAGYLQSGQHKVSCRVAGFCAFCALQEHVQQALASSGKVVSPQKLAKNLRSICRSFRMGRQEDSHEYMRYLLEALHKCCLPPDLAKDSNSKSSQEKSLVYRIFGGQLRSQVKCTVCSHCSNTYDPFLDLSLEIVRADSLPKALSRFTAVDVLDGDNKYRCLRCRKKVRALKHFTIDTVPNILTIQFKRFSSSGGQGGKIDKKVEFGTTLDLKPYVSNAQDFFPKYKLFGVLVHSGSSTHSGHYYSFLRASSDIWHVFDDSRVRQVSEKTVLEQKAYMLFYVREGKRANNSNPEMLSKPKEVFSQPLATSIKELKSSNASAEVAPRRAESQPVIVLYKQKENKPEDATLPKEVVSGTVVPTSMDLETHPQRENTSDPSSSKSSVVVNNPQSSEIATGIVSTNNSPLVASGHDHPDLKSDPKVLSPSLVEEPISKPSSRSVESSVTSTGGDDSKDMQTDGPCSVSGDLGVEDDWDEYYKKGWNPPGTTPQSFMKMLRVIPHTRRYYQARAVSGRRNSKAISSVNGESENGQPETGESSAVIRSDDAKRPHPPNEEAQSKRLQLDRGVYCLTNSTDVNEESRAVPENVVTICNGAKEPPLQEIGLNLCQGGRQEPNQVMMDACPTSNGDDHDLIQSLPVQSVLNGLAKTNDHIDVSNNPLNWPRDSRELQQSGAELRANGVAGNCQSFDRSGCEDTGNSVMGKSCTQKRDPISSGGTQRHSTHDLYGFGVPRWGEVGQDDTLVRDIDRLLDSHKSSSVKPDMWDVEYDRGRSKKVRSKISREGQETNRIDHGNGNDAVNSDNPFQAFAIGKQNGNDFRGGCSVGFKAGKV